MHHTLSLTDGFKMQDKPGSAQLAPSVMYECEVINPIFKNGKQYTTGEKIMLVKKSAQAFKASGDVRVKAEIIIDK